MASFSLSSIHKPARTWISRRLVCLSLLLSVLFWGRDVPTQAAEPTEAKLQTLNAADRQQIDQSAVQLATERLAPDVQKFYSDITGWLVARSPLPVDEEAKRTEAAHNQLLNKFDQTIPSAQALDVLQTLNKALPIRMQPLLHEFQIAVVQTSAFSSETTGAPWIHLSEEFVTRCANDAAGRDRLAFAIAHELGHIIRDHCRRRHQLLWLQDLIRQGRRLHLSSERLKRVIDQRVRQTNDRLEFLTTLEEDREADLFAIHLLRNAGFDIENGVDVVRHEIQTAADEKARTRPLRRLRAIRNEIDGRMEGSEFGLFSIEQNGTQRTRIPDNGLAGIKDAIFVIHGMESDLDTFEILYAELNRGAMANRPVIGFQFPGDASLSRVATFLHNELKRTAADSKSWDFVAHSAGGLVIRNELELHQRPFRRAIFIATPHLGSDLTRLRSLLEVKQFFGDLRMGFNRAVEKTITDGRGQVTWDLQPDSLFLSYLNRPENPREVSQYHIINGRAMSPMKGMLLKTSVAAIRVALKTKVLDSAHAPGSLRRGMQEWTRKLDIPDEIARGDLAVSLDRSTLEDVASEATFEHSHTRLPDRADVIEHVLDLLRR